MKTQNKRFHFKWLKEVGVSLGPLPVHLWQYSAVGFMGVMGPLQREEQIMKWSSLHRAVAKATKRVEKEENLCSEELC
jgi:hypothetical protein